MKQEPECLWCTMPTVAKLLYLVQWRNLKLGWLECELRPGLGPGVASSRSALPNAIPHPGLRIEVEAPARPGPAAIQTPVGWHIIPPHAYLRSPAAKR
eukprot:36320-Rhodomonas_salina.1